MDQEHQERLFKNIIDAVVAVVRGSLVVAMMQGLLAGFAYWAAGVPFAAFWGAAAAFASLLPVGGSAVISIPPWHYFRTGVVCVAESLVGCIYGRVWWPLKLLVLDAGRRGPHAHVVCAGPAALVIELLTSSKEAGG